VPDYDDPTVEAREQARLMANADSHPDTRIGRPEDPASLAPLLAARAAKLLELADDDSVWADVR
jgi:alpha-D-ribose 1-methylphosphonate 5-triphosphate synthase subunit PhnH